VFVSQGYKRASKRIGSKKAAVEVAGKIAREIALERFQIDSPKESPVVKFRDYAEHWMAGHVQNNCKESTQSGYRYMLENHIYPEFGNHSITEITRNEIKTFCYRKLEGGLSARSVSYIARTLSAIFNQSIEDGIGSTNPAARPGKYIRTGDRRDKIDFLTPDEGRMLLETAREHRPRFYPLLLAALRTGMRQGEILALQWGDIDWHGNFIEIRRNNWKGNITTPKSGKGRRVDMSDQLAADLMDHRRTLAAEVLKKGHPMPEWVFPSDNGTPLDAANLRKMFIAVLKKAGLRSIRFHDLRHSFASWLLTPA
jgi:integrase